MGPRSKHIKTHTQYQANIKPKDVLKKDERKNTKDKPFSCSNCDEKFQTNEYLKYEKDWVTHEKSHEPAENKKNCSAQIYYYSPLFSYEKRGL